MTRGDGTTRRAVAPLAARAALVMGLAALGLAGAAAPGHAFVLREWINTAGGAANIASNWYPASVPGPDDEAYFDKSATYTVTWPGPRDSLHDLDVVAGAVTLSMSGALGVSNSCGVAGTATLGVSAGQLHLVQTDSYYKPAGTVTVSGSTASMLLDSPFGTFWWEGGSSDAGVLNVVNGAVVRSNANLAMGNDIGMHTYLTAAHRTGNLFTGYHYPTLTTYGSPGGPGIDLGAYGTFVGDLVDGGTLWSGGNLTLGYRHGGIGQLHVGLVAGVYSGVLVGGSTWIGSNTILNDDTGFGSISIGNGYATFQGHCWLGDPDDSLRAGDVGPRGVISSSGASAHLLFVNGLTMSKYLTGELDLTGGNTQIIGGTTDIRQHAPFEIGGAGSPELWLEGGSTTQVWPNDQGAPALRIGRSGYGKLRVAGAGTALTVHGATAMADSSAGQAYLDVDSTATASLLGPLRLAATAANSVVTVHGGSNLSVGDSLVVGGGTGTAVVYVDTSSTLTVTGSTRMGNGGFGGLYVFHGSQATMPNLTLGPSYANLEVGYGSHLDVSGRFDVTGAAHALVDTGGVIVYAGGARAMTIGEGGAQVYVDRGGQLQASPQIDVRGGLTLTPFIGDLVTSAATSRRMSAPVARRAAAQTAVPGPVALVQSPLVRVVGSGMVAGIGSVAGRLRLESGTATFTVGAPGTSYTGRTVVGDSTKSDGFYSVGQTAVLDGDTLTTLDSDGPDLGKMRIEGGVLQTSKPAHLRAGFRLDGYGTILGSLDVRDSAWVSLAGAVSGDIALAGTLDLETSVAYLSLGAPNGTAFVATLAAGSFHPAATGRTTVRIGSSQDQIVVSGAAVLGGTLDVRTIAGQSPVVGSLYTVLTAAPVTGTFANVTVNGRPSAGVISVLYGSNYVRVVVLSTITTGVDGGDAVTSTLPSELRFAAQGAPRDAALALDLPGASGVRVTLYDVSGRQVATLADAELPAGRHRFELRRIAAGSGFYFARAEVRTTAGMRVLTARAVVLR